jgi:CheY-like chemotaxis protein
MFAAAVRQDVPRILIADADSDTRALYRECLRALEGDVVDAVDGRAALVSALVHRPSLVITDTRLAGFDGYHLCDVLRRDVVTWTVPILVVTSEAMPSELARARDAGADAAQAGNAREAAERSRAAIEGTSLASAITGITNGCWRATCHGAKGPPQDHDRLPAGSPATARVSVVRLTADLPT